MEEKYKEFTIDEFIKSLMKTFDEQERKTKKIYISSDEEQNNIFKKFYIDDEGDYIILTGLTGTEFEWDET